MLFQYDYFEEARAFSKGTVGWYVIRIEPGADAGTGVESDRRAIRQFAK